MKKILIYSILLVISSALILFKENVNIKDDVYVISHSENEEKDAINNQSIINGENSESYNKISKIEITVYISGEVVNPGIVTIEQSKRLYDAVKELGGTTSEADLNRINLAMKLEDEQHYIIPKIGEVSEDIVDNKSLYTSNENINNKININNANIEELDKLPGVGEATANKIVKYREENSKFNSIEEIKNVNGIGDKKYEELKELICVE